MVAEGFLFTQKKSTAQGVKFFSGNFYFVVNQEGKTFIWESNGKTWQVTDLKNAGDFNSNPPSTRISFLLFF